MKNYHSLTRPVPWIKVFLIVTGLLITSPAITRENTKPNVKCYWKGLYVNTYTGNLFYSRQDLCIPGRGPSIEIRFSYNSGRTSRNWGFGNGWSFCFGMHYYQEGNNMVIERGDGRKDIFLWDGSVYIPPPGLHETLTEVETGRFQLRQKNGTVIYFDNPVHKKVTAIEDRNGNTLTFTYAGHTLTAIADASGREILLAWQDGMLKSITDPNTSPQRIILYFYSDDGNLESVVDPLGNHLDYGYGSSRELVQITDASSNLLNIRYQNNFAVISVECPSEDAAKTFSYDTINYITTVTDVLSSKNWANLYYYSDGGQITDIQHPDGGIESFAWDEDNNITSYTDPYLFTTLYDYDDNGNLLGRTDAMGYTEFYQYETEFSQVINYTNKSGITTDYEYDDSGNLVVVTNGMGYTETFTFDEYGNITGITNKNGFTTNYMYNDHGDLIRETDPYNNSMIYDYDDAGNIMLFTDKNNNITAFDYDLKDQLLQIIYPTGFSVIYAYDANGNIISKTNERGYLTTVEYNGMNLPVRVTGPAGNVAEFAYDEAGNLIRVVDPNGNATEYDYTDGFLAGRTDPLGYSEAFQYDLNGNLTAYTDKNGMITTYEYDISDRIITMTDPAGNSESLSYDPLDNIESYTDPNGAVYTFFYDDLSRMTGMTDPGGFTKYLTYDSVGNILSLADTSRNSCQFGYDMMNRITSVISPMGHQYSYTYDPSGNLATRTDPNGNITYYTQDELNRLIHIQYAARDIFFSYDSAGNTIEISGSGEGLAESITRAYDPLNRVTEETVDYGLFYKTVSYAYDAAGNLTEMNDPDGMMTRYTFDAGNRCTSYDDPYAGTVSFDYDAAGKLTSIGYPDGNLTLIEYDSSGHVTRKTTTGPAKDTIFEYEYVRDDAGRIIDEYKNMLLNAHYDYNQTGWLTNEQYFNGDVIQNFYNDNGLRLSKIKNGQVTSYEYDPDERVTRQVFPDMSFIDYIHDNNGNVVQTISAWGTVNYDYDDENRLIKISYPDPYGIIKNYFSAVGWRIGREERGEMTYYLPLKNGVMMEFDENGNTKSRVNDGLILTLPDIEAKSQKAVSNSVHWDGQGSSTFFTYGDVTASFSFDYFGGMLDMSGDPENVDPGLYGDDNKVDWDPLLGAELIGIDYAPDIDQHFGIDINPEFEADLEEIDITKKISISGFLFGKGSLSGAVEPETKDKAEDKPPLPDEDKKKKVGISEGLFGRGTLIGALNDQEKEDEEKPGEEDKEEEEDTWPGWFTFPFSKFWDFDDFDFWPFRDFNPEPQWNKPLPGPPEEKDPNPEESKGPDGEKTKTYVTNKYTFFGTTVYVIKEFTFNPVTGKVDCLSGIKIKF